MPKSKVCNEEKAFLGGFVFYCVLCVSASLLQAGYIYPLEVFTANGGYGHELDLFVEPYDAGTGQVDFIFCNESPIDSSSITEIYFEDGSFLGDAGITEGSETSFSQFARPKNLPGGNTLDPTFVASDGFSFDSDPAPPKNGVNNPGEWLQITFDINGGTFAAVIDGLDTGVIRIAAHVIALPDGSSESAVTVPEPATLCLLGLGAPVLLRKRRPQGLTRECRTGNFLERDTIHEIRATN